MDKQKLYEELRESIAIDLNWQDHFSHRAKMTDILYKISAKDLEAFEKVMQTRFLHDPLFAARVETITAKIMYIIDDYLMKKEK